MLFEKNDFNEPIEMLNQAIQIDTTCEFAYETLATIEIQRFVLLKILNKKYYYLIKRKIFLKEGI